MDEENKKQEAKKDEPEGSTPPKDDGVQSETDSLIEQSNKAAERTEKATTALKAENDRAEKLAIQNQLAGKGQTIPTPTTPKLTVEEQASRERIKAVGNASGAKWAQDMDEKKDEN